MANSVVRTQGDNHIALQDSFTAHMRAPEQCPAPAGLEDRRLQIYRDLLFNNIEGFISRGFPVARQILNDEQWQTMVRGFMSHHCQTPYFPRITEEFLQYMQSDEAGLSQYPPFFLELLHYEWVEVALDIADDDLELLMQDRGADLLSGKPIVSPLAWSLAYQYPVHQIGPSFQPEEPPAEPTFLVVYRTRQGSVKFMEINAVTATLLTLLEESPALSGAQVLENLAVHMPHVDKETVISNGQITLDKLRRLDIILGVAI